MNTRTSLITALLATVGLLGSTQAATSFDGLWQAVGNYSALTVNGKQPPLTAEGKQVYEQRIAARKAKDLSFDTTTTCQPPGLPRSYFMGMPFEVQQQSDAIYINYQWNRLFRVVDMNISHDQQNQYAPLYFGFATGKYEQDTLVIDSILFNDTTLLDDSGLPHSMDLHLVERWNLSKDGNTLNVKFTVEDPQYYSSSWSFDAKFKRLPKNSIIEEDVCLERLQKK